MNTNTVSLTLIDGPTLLIELGGLRFLTDPTFDEPQVFSSAGATERKSIRPPRVLNLSCPSTRSFSVTTSIQTISMLPVARFCRKPER
jgi:hypothetical protein